MNPKQSTLTHPPTPPKFDLPQKRQPSLTMSESSSKLGSIPADTFLDDDKEYKFWPEGISKDIPDVEGTTWLKHVPYDREENWVSGIPGIEVGPVLEVISVSIYNKSDGSLCNDFEIYGEISVTDNRNNTFYVYKRESYDAEAVSPGKNVLSLYGCPVLPVMMGTVQFSLTNKNSGAQIFAGEVGVVDYSITADCEDEEEKLIVKGQGGYYAKMAYNIIPLALIARVVMFLDGPRDAETIYVDGDITANGVSILAKKSFEVERKRENVSDYRVELSRTALAIPVFSRLHFEFSLFLRDGVEFATGERITNPRGRSRTSIFFIACKVKNYNFDMLVECIFPDEFFGLPQVDRTIKAVTSSDHYVEVFSILVGCDDSIPALCGTIVVGDRDQAVCIFSRNKNRPDNLSNKQELRRIVLSLAWPDDRLVVEKKFYIDLDLYDVEGNQICCGGYTWYNEGRLTYPLQFGKRMCVFIPGYDGYFAAVHYSIFKDGKKAKMTIEWKGDYSIVVYGSVFAEYSNYDYRSTYDREYNRIIIFKRSEEDFVEVKRCSRIPLSKSLVIAPSNCQGLFVYVDLKVIGCDVSFPDTTKTSSNKLWFEFGSSRDPSQQLWVYHRSSGSCLGCVTLGVDWSRF